MIKYFLIITFCLLFVTNMIYGQSDLGAEITLTIKHSLKHPLKSITIHLNEIGDSILISVQAISFDSNFSTSKYNTGFKIGNSSFKIISEKFKRISSKHFVDTPDNIYHDGYTVELEFSRWLGSIKYQFFDPTVSTSKRHLGKFLDLTEYIIETAKLNPSEIL